MSDSEDNLDPKLPSGWGPSLVVAGVSAVRETDGRSVPAVTVAGIAALLLAAWCAAGSLGLIAHPLRLGLTYLGLLTAGAAIWPWHGRRRWWLLSVPVVVIFLRIATSTSGSLELLLVAGVAAFLAAASNRRQRQVLRVCASAILTFAVYRLACSSISSVWLLTNFLGETIGRGVSVLTGVRLDVGATFAGLDFLVLMAAWYAVWLVSTEGPRWRRALAGAVAILGVHLLYLLVLSQAMDLVELLPVAESPTFDHPYVPPPWRWSNAVRQLLPWNLPALAAVLHVAVASLMIRWSSWPTGGSEHPKSVPGSTLQGSAWRSRLRLSVPCLLAVLLPISATLSPVRSNLTGKRFIANQAGNLNWNLPQHDWYGQASAGWFGMLPHLIGSLGGELRLSSDFSAADLSQADVALLLHPTGPLAEPFQQRLGDFVRNGGTLLVVAEPYQQQGGVHSASNDVLAATGIRVQHDVAVSEAGTWQHGCDLVFHGATYGIGLRNGAFFTDAGVSLRLGWPARPIILGRWGWSDPGSDAILTGVSRFETGERLGDLVLAAEQRVGAGLVAVLGDAHALTNEGGVRGYEFTGRLLSSLAHRTGSPQTPWRQAATLLLAAGVLVSALRRPSPACVLGVVVFWAWSQTACEAISCHVTRVVPDGRLVQLEGPATASRLAYLDASHVSPGSDASWDFDGINGLALTLMRSGYLTLTLPEVSRERLERAAVFVSVAPARRFTVGEREGLRAFVENGGTFFCLVGAEEAAASAELLADFGLHVSPSPVPTAGRWREPEPLGHTRAVYWDARQHGRGEYQASVQFHAAWPVAAEGDRAETLVSAPNGQPVVVAQRFGRGCVVLIADTGFALNKNLEYVGGEPFGGGYENAHFWRWLISRVTGRAEWTPPAPPPAPDETAGASEEAT